MNKLKLIEEATDRILQGNSGPVVRFRLLRDVLRRAIDDHNLVQARKDLSKSLSVQELVCEQQTNGSWGRFHARTSKTDSPIPKTEFAVDRALALGLRKNDPLLAKASKYITDLLQEKTPFPDPAEKNTRWPTGWRLFCAGTLAKFRPNSKVLDESWRIWAEIAQRTFASGKYDPAQEILAHAELTGAPADLRYLRIDNKYSVSLIGARTDSLPPTIEKTLVMWLWNKSNGMMYYCMRPSAIPKRVSPGAFDRWLCSHELLSIYPTWRKLAVKTIDWLWTQQNQDGLWNFGPRGCKNTSCYLPLSDNWRKKQNRQYDWSTRVLILLRNYYD
ncbi:MAG: hypothetical protein ACYS0I_03950 [Planctomycetota bacterium]|jgi:hypothetical protein